MDVNANDVRSGILSKNAALVERWEKSGYLKGINDDWKKYTVAQLLENHTREHLKNVEYHMPQYVTEATLVNSPGISTVDRYTFPLIRTIFANLVSSELVSVQPLDGPHSTIFSLRYILGSSKNGITAGTEAFEGNWPDSYKGGYTDPTIVDEIALTGDGANVTITGNLSWYPVIPGTVTIKLGSETETDVPASGGKTGTFTTSGITEFSSGSINYETGAISITMTGGNPVTNGTNVTASYTHNMEATNNLPEVNIKLTGSPISVVERGIKANWSMDAATDLQNMHGISAEVEIGAVLTEIMKYDVDRMIIDDIYNSIPDTNDVDDWSYTPETGVSLNDHIQSLRLHLMQMKTKIFQATRRIAPNWIVASPGVADYIGFLPQFQSSSMGFTGQGVQYIGDILGMRVYIDPFFPANEFMMGYRGSNILDAGYVYAPYQPFYTTGTITLDDFLHRRGVKSRYGKKIINPDFFAKSGISA